MTNWTKSSDPQTTWNPTNQNTFGYALQFDGAQNYLDIGTLEDFGSKMINGFYAKFRLQTTSQNRMQFGCNNASDDEQVYIEFNRGAAGDLGLLVVDKYGNALSGKVSSSGIFDGKSHLVEIFAAFPSNTIAINIDGIAQTISYDYQQTASVFSNLDTHFLIGADIAYSVTENFFNGIIDDFVIGISPSVIYGSYSMNEGVGNTTLDESGKGNNGTLIGSPLPAWVGGLTPISEEAKLWTPGVNSPTIWV